MTPADATAAKFEEVYRRLDRIHEEQVRANELALKLIESVSKLREQGDDHERRLDEVDTNVSVRTWIMAALMAVGTAAQAFIFPHTSK